MSSPDVISVDHVSFSYGGDNVVISDASFSVRQGDFACMVGPNGGGKTTLLKLIVGLLEPDAGRIRLFGRSPSETRHRIGYMPQRARLDPRFPVRVRDVVLMGRLGKADSLWRFGKAHEDVAAHSLVQVGLYESRNRSFSALSEGQRQRVLVARALACEPDLLLLDEPTANLDLPSQNELYELLHVLNESITIVMVSHDVAFVSKFVRTVACVNRSVVVHAASEISGDTVNEVFGYGRDMRMIMHDHSHAK